jgi:hypothetical protein
MTLDIENCHATVHAKKVKMSKLEYAGSFGATMKLHITTPVEGLGTQSQIQQFPFKMYH